MSKTVRLVSGALVLLAALAAGGAAWGAVADPIHDYPSFNDYADADRYYTFGDHTTEYGYHYQLRDVSGARDGHTVAGAQWFATSYENYLWRYVNEDLNGRLLYRRTLGGETPEVPLTTSADLLYDFEAVYIDEPQPYPAYPDTRYRDACMDPIESIALVLPEGRGQFKVSLANHYARHFPYWWRESGGGHTPINPPPVLSGDVVSHDVISRDVMEDVLLSAEGYAVSVQPNRPQRVMPGKSMTANVSLTAENPEAYGSRLGYIAFRQSASFDTGYVGWRESLHVPVVVANVHDGPASDPGNELYFDMMIFNRTLSGDTVVGMGDIEKRIQFRWGADREMTQDLGALYMMRHSLNSGLPSYHLETRITNRTGTRYRLQRYDMIGGPRDNTGSGDVGGGSWDMTARYTFRDIRPDHWKYDLTPDLYGSLPDHFQLDAHSQIAPGLVTVYKNRVGTGYSTLNTSYGTSESFRLYPFSEARHHDLRLSYRRVGGMALTGGASEATGRWRVQGFRWDQFADVVQNDEQTTYELEKLMGKPASLGSSAVGASDAYVRSSALNAFEIKTDVPAGLVSMDVSMDVVVSKDVSGDVVQMVSRDVPATIAVQPMRVRLRIPRREQILVGRWEQLSEAADGKALLKQFMRFGTVWLRSGRADERDTNLFTAISQRGVDPAECVSAFLYNDELYLDFILLLADAKSPREGYTAYLRTFRDDGIPYILIGDGAADGVWNLGLYVDAAGANPESGRSSDDVNPRPQEKEKEEGGGCNAASGLGLILSAFVGALFLERRIR